MKAYQKPNIKFSDIRNNKNIADTCWGLSGETKENGKPGTANYSGPFTYDVKGAGYVSFWVKGTGSCQSPDAFNIMYFQNSSDTTGDSVLGQTYEQELETALSTKSTMGGNSGQPYSGLSTDFPKDPDPRWS